MIILLYRDAHESFGGFEFDYIFVSAQRRRGEMEKIMNEKPLDYGTLTKEQFDAEIEKGIADIKAGRVYSADEVEKEMKELMK